MNGYYDFMYGDVATWTLLIAGFIIVLIAQLAINSAYSKYKKIRCSKNITGAEVARMILKSHGLDLYVVETQGNLTDHYDPSRKVIKLSSDIFKESSIAAVSVAAHECGHAIQDQDGYTFMRIRTMLVPVVNFINYAGYFAMFISIFAGAMQFLLVGIIMVLATLVFQLITLPVEFDASKRGIEELQKLDIVDQSEITGAKSMLKAAAFTYVAGVLASLMQLLRLLLMYSRNRD